MSVLLFEDETVGRLNPVTLAKPAFAVTCGGYRLIDLVERLDPSWRAIVRPHLRGVVAEDFPHATGAGAEANGPVLAVNARLLPRAGILAWLRHVADRGRPVVVVSSGGDVVCALLPAGRSPSWDSDPARLSRSLDDLPREEAGSEAILLKYPHDLLAHHRDSFRENLDDRLASGRYREIADGLFAAPGAVLGQHVVTDTREGPVVLDHGAQIGPYTLLEGPVYVGPHSRVIEHSALKDGVAVGHTCKIGGEVEASIIEPYTNKQHHGFLGHSYLGSWINLGAGTSNSDLKNTYGNVTMEYDGRRVPTGMQFVGCIMGDYAKTAVNTSIFTGKTIGVCTMVYGFVTTNVPSFVNYARSFGQVTEVPDEVMIASQARMFKRRNVVQRACDIQLLRDIHVLTRHERRLANEPLSF
ncbi:MAG TPA: glucose-1-phosphate thymidylyltransferase [Planctomycetaceae bacterium]|nr:glucose-1-phosphate thymidylyltransferase [Planctomycetaceae bacterium]HIQ22741.1 glucose-1-phosphate thymidylyltransferase [Planctomycetota bacterium]